MVDDKKPDLNFEDWDSLPVAPDDDWDDIPLPQIESSASSPVTADDSGSGASSFSDQLDLDRTKMPRVRSIDLNIDNQRSDKAAGTDSINSILTDDDDLNEDFDDLVDISSDVDDIDVGEPSEVTEAALTVAEPVAVQDKPAQPLSEAFEAAEPLVPEELPVSEAIGAFDIERDTKADASPFGDLGFVTQGGFNAEEQQPSFDAHLADDPGSGDDELKSETSEEALSAKTDGLDSGGGVSGLPDDDSFDAAEPSLEAPEPSGSDEQTDLSTGDSLKDSAGSVQAEARTAPNAATVSPLPSSLSSDIQEMATQKVELDIEGIFLDDQGHPSQDGQETPSEEKDPDVSDEQSTVEEPKAPAPVANPSPAVGEETAPAGGLKGLLARLKSLPGNLKNIPKPKLALILLPVFLILMAAAFGMYKLIFTSGDTSSAAMLIIDPQVPLREAEPGTLDLGVFYVGFPGEPGAGETIAEISFVVHYRDIPDKVSLERKMTQVRDLIYRSALGKGNQLVASGDVQRDLREELTSRLNEIVGEGDHVDYVQIGQIRILR